MLTKYPALGRATVFGLVLLLSACGGGGGSKGKRGSDEQANGSDSFISRVMSLIGNSSDTAEPIDIKSIEVTSPENTEPALLR